MTEDEMVGQHHRLSGREFEQTPGDSEGQGKPGVLQSVGLQRLGHDLAPEQQGPKLLGTASEGEQIMRYRGKMNTGVSFYLQFYLQICV